MSELIVLQRPPQTLGKPTKRDREIFLMKKRGWTDEQLAVRFGVKEPAIRLSIDRYNLFRDSFANDEIDLELNQLAVRMMPKVEKVLADGMKAAHMTNIGLGDQVIMRKVADHATRLETVKIVKSLMETSRPKGGGVQINTQINAPGTQQSEGPRGFDFEARLRNIREKKGLGNNEEIIDADYEEPAMSTAAEELAEMGLDIDDDDDEDEE